MSSDGGSNPFDDRAELMDKGSPSILATSGLHGVPAQDTGKSAHADFGPFVDPPFVTSFPKHRRR